jgi:hypothetical protein
MGGYSTIPSLISGYKYFRLPRQPFMYRVFFWQAKMDVVCADDTLGQRQRMMARTWNKSGSRTKLELVSARSRGVFAFGSRCGEGGAVGIPCLYYASVSAPEPRGFWARGREGAFHYWALFPRAPVAPQRPPQPHRTSSKPF